MSGGLFPENVIKTNNKGEIRKNTSPVSFLQNGIGIDLSNSKHISQKIKENIQELFIVIENFQTIICTSWIPFFNALHDSLHNQSQKDNHGCDDESIVTIKNLDDPAMLKLFSDYQAILEFAVSAQGECRKVLVHLGSNMVPNFDGSLADPCDKIYIDIKGCMSILLQIKPWYSDFIKDVNEIKSEKLLTPTWGYYHQQLAFYCNECILNLNHLNNNIHRSKPFIESSYKNIMRSYVDALKNVNKHEKMYM